MRYFIGSLVAIFLFIVILVLLFKGGPDNPNSRKPIDPVSLVNTDNEVRFVVDGQINADSTHREIRLTISGSQSRLEVIQGYQGNVISTHVINNNPASFTAFLHSLRIAGFSNGELMASQDQRGYCPLGYRYLYEVISPTGGVRQKLWSDACGGGTMKGDRPLIRQLFQKQFPKYTDWTGDVRLSA